MFAARDVHTTNLRQFAWNVYRDIFYGSGNTRSASGEFEGLGAEAQCEVLARRLSIKAGNKLSRRPYAYANCSVIGAPDLPDGEYIVYFDGYSFAVIRQRGLWFSHGPLRGSMSRDQLSFISFLRGDIVTCMTVICVACGVT
jgi:hypothetical protein